MGVEHKVSADGRELTISVAGRFDFTTKTAVKEAYSGLDLTQVQINIDLAECNYMDSSALGMLLLLREKAGGDQASIALKNCQTAAMELLKMSRCDELFDVN